MEQSYLTTVYVTEIPLKDHVFKTKLKLIA